MIEIKVSLTPIKNTEFSKESKSKNDKGRSFGYGIAIISN